MYKFRSVSTLLLLSVGCGHLNRNTVKAQLQHKIEAENVDIEKKEVVPSLQTFEGKITQFAVIPWTEIYCDITNEEETRQDLAVAFLGETGYINVTKARDATDPNNLIVQISLTNLGHKFAQPGKNDLDQRCTLKKISIPLVTYDHFDVTRIVEDGIRARADVTTTYTVTPVGRDLSHFLNRLMEHRVHSLFKQNKDFQWENTQRVAEILIGERLLKWGESSSKLYHDRSYQFEKTDEGWEIAKDQSGSRSNWRSEPIN